MYSSFPSLSRAFYISDKKGKVIPIRKYFHYNSSDLTHNYYAIEKQPNMTGQKEIGQKMWVQIEQYRFAPIEEDSVQVREMDFEYQDRKLLQISKTLYETQASN
jgi:hypothetical protein